MGGWADLLTAVTTPFGERGGVDLSTFRSQLRWLEENGAVGVVVAGELGEGIALSFEERLDLLRTATEVAEGWVVAVVGDTSTRRAVRFAREAEAIGSSALIIEPPCGYPGPWHEIRAHFGEVLAATALPCAVENRPLRRAVDLLPGHIVELAAAHPNLVAAVESSGDPRRLAELHALAGPRLELLAGADEIAPEAIGAGAVGWISGLANVLPAETAAWFALLRSRDPRGEEVHRWLLPLLRLAGRADAVPSLKQLQHAIGQGNARVRPPRLALPAAEREPLARELRAALAASPLAADLARWPKRTTGGEPRIEEDRCR